MTKKLDLITARFDLNMGRIARLSRLVMSDNIEQLKPTGFGQYEGVAADLLRFVVVFLHAAFEDIVRSLIHQPKEKKWTFNSATDIDKALRRASIDPQDFKSLYPPLTQLAKRRKRIVHQADFSTPTETTVAIWNIADYWQLCIWNLAVLCFYYHLLSKIEPGNDKARTAHNRLVQAMSGFVDFGHQMVALSKTPPDLSSRVNAIRKMSDTLTIVLSVLQGASL